VTTSNAKQDADVVRKAIVEDLKVHVRLSDQGLAPGRKARRALAEALPPLTPFGGNRFAAVRAVLDWDHRSPSEHMILRIFACYNDDETRQLEAELRSRDDEIDEDNLYPEFDLPDYGEIEAGEVYAAVLTPEGSTIEDLRFLSEWRKHVTPTVAQPALGTVRNSKTYKHALKQRTTEGLGAAVVVGWAPPCLAHSSNWAIEIWLITEFDGQSGKAHVFMVDSEAQEITREFETDVHLA
jgi:hypothetical protein